VDLKYKQISFDIKSSTDSDKFYTFSGYASTFGNEDLVGDIIEQGAFTDSLKQRKPKLLYQHDRSMVLGTITKSEEDNHGLFITAQLPKENSLAKDVGVLMKTGAVDSMSIGFIISDFEENEDHKFVIKKLDLYEISVVTFPANPQAMVTEVKSVPKWIDYPIASKDVSWDKSEAVKDIKSTTGSKDSPNAKYRNGFMWYDAEKSGIFGSYKLPYVASVDGKLHVIPRAIFAIRAALGGARGGVDIPDADKNKIKTRINKYYKLMGKDEPFVKMANFHSYADVENITSKRDLEDILRESGVFSRRAATFIASLINEKQSDSVDKKEEDSIKILSELSEIINKIGE
jgi:HK97 family phage prohead protease